MIKRIIVCGGRDFRDKQKCFSVLEEVLGRYKTDELEIVSGHASGADSFGEEYAKLNGIKSSVFKPEWKRYGRAAGPIRNKEMLKYAEEETPIVVAFWDGTSRGTKNMISVAQNDGAEVHVISY